MMTNYNCEFLMLAILGYYDRGRRTILTKYYQLFFGFIEKHKMSVCQLEGTHWSKHR